MKKFIFYFGFILISAPVMAQDFGRDAGISIPKVEVKPTLSFLVPEPDFGSMTFYLTEVNFEKEIERPEINMVAVMERKKYLKEQKSGFEAPLWAMNDNQDDAVLKVSQHIGIYGSNTNYNINYNPYTGKIYNAAFEEAKTQDFIRRYDPFYHSRYYRPYY
ncbi:MAG TPA: hypothetical protein VFI78_06420 [Salinimicrobium sp.]|nr:hypothetical protein [Salinimicrobium sp.]